MQKKYIYWGVSFPVALGWLDAVACMWGDLLGFMFLLCNRPYLQCSESKIIPVEHRAGASIRSCCLGIGEEVDATGFKG